MATYATSAMDYNGPVTGGGNAPPHMQDDDSASDIRLCKSLMEQGKAYRQAYDDDWQARRRYYDGKQWSDNKTQNIYRSKPIFNVIRQTIQGTLPILTDNRPGFNFFPKNPSDLEFSKMCNEILESWWEKSGIDHDLVAVLHDSMLYDCGIIKITWDPDAEEGAGDVKVAVISPFDVYVPYGAEDFNKSCGWVIHKTYKEVGALRRMFPQMSEQIKSDDAGINRDGKSGGGSGGAGNIGNEQLQIVSPTDQYSKPGMSGTGGSGDTRKMVEVWECWIDDEETEKIVLQDENGQDREVEKKKWPNGKVVTVLPNQSLRLNVSSNPYKHAQKPFVRFIDAIIPREFYGEGEAKSLMSTQRMINKVLAHTFDYFNLMSNPIWINESDSGVSSDDITNQIALILTTKPGGADKIRREFPPALQSGALDFYSVLINQAEQISGISEITQGRKPTGVSAASAIENLQEAAQTRIRLKERNMQVSLTQMARQIISLMMQYYTEPRVARITGESGQWPDYFEYFFEATPDGKQQMTYKKYQYNDQAGAYGSEPNYLQTQPTYGLMDISVKSGTSMPWAKTQRTNIAFRLFDSQAIDVKELLDTLEWPNAEQVMARQQEAAQAAAQAQAQASTQGQAPIQ